MVIGCDGIFDVLNNEELFEIWNIALTECKNNINNKEKKDDIDIHYLCGKFAEFIIKSALAKNSFDNVSCIIVVFNINTYSDEKIIEIKDKMDNININEEKKEE